MKKEKIPKIVVLMATYNGKKWLAEQVDSILNQQDVEIRLIVSDDNSTDGTLLELAHFAENDARITVLPSKGKFGSASENFYRLIKDANISDCDYIAFADQDDIWFKNKLSYLSTIAYEANADGVSSNVTAFWPDGSRKYINKAGKLRKLDFLFECSGPGCTFLMSPWLIQQAKSLLIGSQIKANQLKAHDWLMYAICRASGRIWVISKEPTVEYRQHANNELGVHKGLKARWNRLQKLRSGWYKAEVIKTCQLSLQLTQDPYVEEVCKIIIMANSGLSRLRLLMYVNHFRRSVFERIFFGFAIVSGCYK